MARVAAAADGRGRSRPGRSLVGVVVAAASVAAVATGAFVVVHGSGTNSTAAQSGGPVVPGAPVASGTPAPSPSSAAPSSTPSASATGPAAAACQARDLRVSYDADRSGAAAGSTNVAIELENAGNPCWIAGFPVLSRIDAAGRSTRLDLTPEPYPTYDLLVQGPGLLAHDARAGILLHYSSQGCADATRATGRWLRVTTADGSSAETDFPADLGICAGSHGFQAEAGLLKPL